MKYLKRYRLVIFPVTCILLICGCNIFKDGESTARLNRFRGQVSNADSVVIKFPNRDTAFQLDKYHRDLFVEEFGKLKASGITQKSTGKLTFFRRHEEMATIGFTLKALSPGFQLQGGDRTFNYSMTYRLGMFLSEL